MYSESLNDAAMWLEVLRLSRVKPGETVCVLTGAASNERNFRAAMRASQELGCTTFQLHIPPAAPIRTVGADRTSFVGVTPLSGNRAAIETLKNVSFVADLMGLLHSPEQLEILKAGTRMLMVLEPPEILARLVPTEEDKRRVMAADARLRRAKNMNVTSPAGTNVSFSIGQFPTLPEYGYADEPGHWDHWPSGFTSTWPNEGQGEGKLVIDVGDMLFPFKIYATSQVTLHIERGLIRSIEGGFEAEYLKEYMASYNDPGAYGISHIGYGLQPRAKWTALQMQHDKSCTLGMDGRSFYGNFLFSTGPNSEAGGRNDSRCHIDIPMRNCTVLLDGETMVQDGDVVAADQRVKDAAPQTGVQLIAAE
jgi:2,5-dihydroxypyridine 5,6-dioxygenase